LCKNRDYIKFGSGKVAATFTASYSFTIPSSTFLFVRKGAFGRGASSVYQARTQTSGKLLNPGASARHILRRGDKIEKCLLLFLSARRFHDANMRAQEMYLFASLFISGLLVNLSPPACENSAAVEFLAHTAERENA
jgi:hypothetical protein